MKALDTNVLVRFFVDDPEDPDAARQRPAAFTAMSERSLVTVTVVLEFEWVLRGFYSFARREIVGVLRALAAIEHVTLEDRPSVLGAIDLLEQGLDFADALHLARATRAAAFLTFDRRLAKRSLALKLAPAVELPE